MDTLHSFVVRDDSSSTMTPTMLNLLIALVVLFATVVVLVGGLLLLRSIRRSRKAKGERLPTYSENPTRNHRGLSIGTPSYVVAEKQSLIDNSASPPPSPVPEIRITLPEEVDDSGRRTSGRVVVVRVGETSVGLEPVNENLPPYQTSEAGRFQSLDLERMGGLKEKELEKRWS
jgi:hypothetical protein